MTGAGQNKQSLSFIPFHPCPIGQGIAKLSLFINPIIWPLFAYYIYNYYKSKDAQEDIKSRKRKSYNTLTAISVINIAFYLTANAAAIYCLSRYIFRADKITCIVVSIIFSGVTLIGAITFSMNKYQQSKNLPTQQQSSTDSKNEATTSPQKDNNKSVAFLLFYMSLAATGIWLIPLAILGFPIIWHHANLNDKEIKNKRNILAQEVEIFINDQNNKEHNKEATEILSKISKLKDNILKSDSSYIHLSNRFEELKNNLNQIERIQELEEENQELKNTIKALEDKTQPDGLLTTDDNVKVRIRSQSI